LSMFLGLSQDGYELVGHTWTNGAIHATSSHPNSTPWAQNLSYRVPQDKVWNYATSASMWDAVGKG
jgi:hypothetical protein